MGQAVRAIPNYEYGDCDCYYDYSYCNYGEGYYDERCLLLRLQLLRLRLHWIVSSDSEAGDYCYCDYDGDYCYCDYG